MKKLVHALAVVAVAVIPITAMAATLSGGQEYALSSQKSVDGNLYVAAGTATVGGRVLGDLIAAGGTVSVTGSVGGDVLAGGGTVAVLGPVAGDARVLGGTLTVNERVGGDVVVLGGSVHILPGAVIMGDLVAAGGSVIVDGNVARSVHMRGGMLVINGNIGGDVTAKVGKQLTLGSSARIGGNLTYSSPSQVTLHDGAIVAGTTSYNPRASLHVSERTGRNIFLAFLAILTGLEMLATLGLAAVLVWLRRRQSLELMSSVHSEIWKSLGRGVVYGILVPIAGLLLCISFIGTLPGILLLMAYGAALILTKALAGMLFGSWLVMAINKRPALHITWGSALGGVILLRIVSLIPVVGWIVAWIVGLAVFGAVAHAAQERIVER